MRVHRERGLDLRGAAAGDFCHLLRCRGVAEVQIVSDQEPPRFFRQRIDGEGPLAVEDGIGRFTQAPGFELALSNERRQVLRVIGEHPRQELDGADRVAALVHQEHRLPDAVVRLERVEPPSAIE